MTNSADPDQKPTDLNLHRLLRQSMSFSAREGLNIQLNFVGSSIFGTIEICLRQGKFEPLRVNHSTGSGSKWR